MSVCPTDTKLGSVWFFVERNSTNLMLFGHSCNKHYSYSCEQFESLLSMSMVCDHVDEAQTMVFLNRMSKGWGNAFAEAWLTKLKDECITDADKIWTKIKKAFKVAFTPYDAVAWAQVALTSLNQDWKNPSGFNKYISSFSLLSVHSGITNYHALLEWFPCGLDPQITVQLTLLGAVKASTTM